MKETLTRDHFTPRSIARVLGWTQEEMNDSLNLQYLPWSQHAKKDQTTPWELECVKLRGGAKTIWEHHNEYVFLRRGNPQIEGIIEGEYDA